MCYLNISDVYTTPEDVFIGADLKPATNKITTRQCKFKHYFYRQLILKFTGKRLKFTIVKSIIFIVLDYLTQIRLRCINIKVQFSINILNF